MTDGNQTVGKVMTSDINETATWQDGTSNFSMVLAFIVNEGAAYSTLGNNTWKF